MVERIAGVLRETGLQNIYTVGRQPELKRLRIPALSESLKVHHHPLYGIATTLEELPDPLVLFVPCDLVNLTTDHIRPLLAYGSACTAASNGHIHPLLCVLGKSMAPTARQLASEQKPAYNLIEHLPSVELPEPVLIDANRPEQVPR
jgi:molybdopterin-guanine dinucleotide biosynthesis protein A